MSTMNIMLIIVFALAAIIMIPVLRYAHRHQRYQQSDLFRDPPETSTDAEHGIGKGDDAGSITARKR